MDGIITALKETPIPTILVIAGIAFLLLSIAGQLAGRIAVPPERQRWAAVVGSILLVAGVALYIIPPTRIISPQPSEVPPPSSFEPATKEKPPPSPPEAQKDPEHPPPPPPPATQDIRVESIKSLDVRVTGLRFFMFGPSKEKLYKRRFANAFTSRIYAEIALKHPKPGRRIDFILQGRLRDPRREVISAEQISRYIAADWENFFPLV
jgi:hypothetical protein